MKTTDLAPGAHNHTPSPEERPERVQGDVFDDLWRLFSSPKLALGLTLAIVAASFAGALIAQAPSEVLRHPDAFQTWVERIRPKFGPLTDVFQTLQLFWVFETVWFRGLLGLLAINTVICTVNRLPSIWRAVFQPAIRPGDGLFERGRPRQRVQLAGTSIGDMTSPAEMSSPVHQSLRRQHYRVVATTDDGRTYLYADRNRFARFGTLLTHLAIIVGLAGTAVSGPLGFFEEPVFAVPVGSTRDVGHDTRLAIEVDDFADEYHPDGRPKDYRTEAVLYESGREVARQAIRVNEPLIYNGVRFHQSFYGQAAMLSVSDSTGSVLFRDAVALTWRSNDGTRAVGYFFLPAQDLHVYLIGTAGQSDTLIRPGEIVVEAYKGAVRLPTERATLTQRQAQSISGLAFLFERELPFTGLRVVRDPGASIIWIASTMIVLGMILTFYFPHRRMWARVQPEPAGVGIVLVGAGRDMATEIQNVAQRLRQDFGAIFSPEDVALPMTREGAEAVSESLVVTIHDRTNGARPAATILDRSDATRPAATVPERANVTRLGKQKRTASRLPGRGVAVARRRSDGA
jgi:cytochrome c biogenesis protein